MLTVNALVAADGVLIPMQCEYYALEGLSALGGTIERIRGSVNPDLEIEGSAAHHVRPAQQPGQRGVGAAHHAFRRQGVSHRDSAQRAPGRGAEFRQAGAVARQGVARRAGLPGARRRDDSPRRTAGRARMCPRPPTCCRSRSPSATEIDRMSGKKPSLGRGLAELDACCSRGAPALRASATAAGSGRRRWRAAAGSAAAWQDTSRAATCATRP